MYVQHGIAAKDGQPHLRDKVEAHSAHDEIQGSPEAGAADGKESKQGDRRPPAAVPRPAGRRGHPKSWPGEMERGAR